VVHEEPRSQSVPTITVTPRSASSARRSATRGGSSPAHLQVAMEQMESDRRFWDDSYESLDGLLDERNAKRKGCSMRPAAS